MLVLSRKHNEDVVIKTPEGRVITVKIVHLLHDRVKLGFTANYEITIDRKEILTQEELSRGLERPTTDGPVSAT